MFETVATSFISGLCVFAGQALNWFVSEEPRLYVWSIFCYVFAVLFAITAVSLFICSVARLIARRGSAGGHKYNRKRR